MSNAPEGLSRTLLEAVHFEHSHAHTADRFHGLRYQLRITLKVDDRGISVLKSIEIQTANGGHSLPTTICFPKDDRRHLGELLFLLAAKLKYDLLRGYVYDSAGFLHSDEIVGLHRRGLTGVPATVYASLRALWREAKGPDGQYFHFIHRFLAQRDQLWHLVCFCGHTDPTADGQSLAWWLNIHPEELSFFYEGSTLPIADDGLKEPLAQLFPKSVLFGEPAWHDFLSTLDGRLAVNRQKVADICDVSDANILGGGRAEQVTATMNSANQQLVGNQSPLADEVLSYLRNLAGQCEDLPPYLPQHLRVRDSEIMPFDELRQTVQLIADRSRLDQWLAKERERLVREGLDPDSIAYGPRRSAPEESEQERRPEIETVDWDERASRRFKRAVILGDPGFGKTWLLKYEARRLALEAIKGFENGMKLDVLRLPIFCRLSDLSSSDRPLHESLLGLLGQEHTETFCHFVGQRLETDHCVLLLDAWDEVPEKLRLQKRVAAFARRFSQPGILLTSRIVGYETTLPPLPQAKELEVMAFDWRKIKTFVQRWFREETELGKVFLAKLEKNHQIKGLARIPLMLNLICRVCPEGDFPQHRSQLYEACTKGLLRDWVRYDQKPGATDIELDGAYLEILLKRLGTLAWELFRKGYEQFSQAQLVEILGHRFDDEKALELIRQLKHRGILVAANSSKEPPLLFLHRTFQEYLAARAMATESSVVEIAIEHLYDSGWHEVLVLLSGLLGDRTRSYIAALLREDRNDPLHRPLLLALDAAAEAGNGTLPEGFLKGMAQVTAEMYFDLRCPIELSPARFVPLLGEWLLDVCIGHGKHKEREVRRRAFQALREIGSREATSALVVSLGDEDVEVRQDAAMAMYKSSTPEAIRRLIGALQDQDHVVQLAAAEALSEIGWPEGVSVMMKAIKDEGNWLPCDVARILCRTSSSEGIGTLVEVLRNEDDRYIRGDLAEVLAAIDSPEAVPLLIEALREEDALVRRSAAQALGHIGSHKAIRPLIEVLKDPDYTVRALTAQALGQIGSPEAVVALIEALDDEHEDVRELAAGALGGIGSAEAADGLTKALMDRDRSVRVYAAAALCELGSSGGVAVLMEALKLNDHWMCERAVKALGKIASSECVDALIDAIKNGSWWARSCAVEALGRIGSSENVGALMEALKDEDGDMRWRAVEALGRIGSPESVDALIEALKDENDVVRMCAAEALGRIGSPEGVDALIQTLGDREPRVHREAAKALKQIFRGPMSVSNRGASPRIRPSRKSVEALIRLLEPSRV